MTEEYVPVLLQVIIAAGFAAVTLIISLVAGQVGKRNKIKDSAYECGMLPEGKSQPRFSVKFYLVAMLFILLDVEVVFLYPWAVTYAGQLREFQANPEATGLAPAFWAMIGFVGIIFVGYLYALNKGALNWRKS